MARLYQGGAEVHGVIGATFGTIDGAQGGGGGVWTRDTSVFRSGVASWKCDSGAGNSKVYVSGPVGTINASRTGYLRGYFQIPAAPTTTTIILCFGGSFLVDLNARLNTSGQVEFLANNTLTGSASSNICGDGLWHRLEISGDVNASNQWTRGELLVDGVSLGVWTGAVSRGIIPFWGWCDVAPGANKVIYVDDVVVQDSTGAANNSWPGDSNVILMKPSSDSQVGSWTGGAGGVTNLFDAVNNTPPIGTASETDLTQIESADSSGDNATDEYRGNCGSYTAAGIGASDTINAITPVISQGEDVATGTKTGSFGLQANPAQAYDAFTFGQDAGALGTWGTNWQQINGTVANAPSVTKGSNLILAVRKTDTGTRVGSVCFLGAYVDYTPAPSGGPVMRYKKPHRFLTLR